MKHVLRFFHIPLVAALIAATILYAGQARAADTCWHVEGSLVRLKSDGTLREFYYEIPSEERRREGVYEGELLLYGEQRGKYFQGNLLDHDDLCSDTLDPLFVEGIVHADNRVISLNGSGETFNQCNATGIVESRDLILTYIRDC